MPKHRSSDFRVPLPSGNALSAWAVLVTFVAAVSACAMPAPSQNSFVWTAPVGEAATEIPGPSEPVELIEAIESESTAAASNSATSSETTMPTRDDNRATAPAGEIESPHLLSLSADTGVPSASMSTAPDTDTDTDTASAVAATPVTTVANTPKTWEFWAAIAFATVAMAFLLCSLIGRRAKRVARRPHFEATRPAQLTQTAPTDTTVAPSEHSGMTLVSAQDAKASAEKVEPAAVFESAAVKTDAAAQERPAEDDSAARALDASAVQVHWTPKVAQVPAETYAWIDPVSVPNTSMLVPVAIPASLSPLPVAVELPDAAEALKAAKQKLSAGKPQEALRELAQVIGLDNAPADAWAVAGWAWWRLAQDGREPALYAEAAAAFEQALQREPQRGEMHSCIARCLLLQAGGEPASVRAPLLDRAIACFQTAVEAQHTPGPKLLIDWGDALFQRATLVEAVEHQPQGMDHLKAAEAALRRAIAAGDGAAGDAAWLLHQVLRVRAGTLPAREADALLVDADALLLAGANAAVEPHRPMWQAARLDNGLAWADRASAADRLLRLRSLREQYQAAFNADGVPPLCLLAWVELLSCEAMLLRGMGAAAKLDEAAAVLRRLDGVLPGDLRVPATHARLLRMRAKHERGGTRLATLSEAAAQLAPVLAREDAAELCLESARIALEQAAMLPATEAAPYYAAASAQAEPLLASQWSGAALHCLLEARLRSDPSVVEPTLAARLLAVAGHNPAARLLIAESAQRAGDSHAANAHREAAMRSGHARDARGLHR